MWDEVIMNKKANSEYRLTKEWSKWIVDHIVNGVIYIKFTYITERRDLVDKVYDINPKYMINLSTIPKKNIFNFLKKGKNVGYIEEKLEENLFILLKNIIKDREKEEINKKQNREIQKENVLDILLKDKFFIRTKSWNYVLNHIEMSKFVSPKLYKLYQDRNIYSKQSVNSLPPAESQPHVLMLELTQWCNHNKCTYCDLYKWTKFLSKTSDEFKHHVDEVIKKIWNYKRNIERVFIWSGNALDIKQKVLLESLLHITKKLSPRRIAVYWNSNAIKRKWLSNLRELNSTGLDMVYWWIESWSDDVLDYVYKCSNKKEILQAWEIINNSWIDLSIMLMPWLWWIRFFDEHIQETIKIINSIDAKYITFMWIDPSENSRYNKIMQREIQDWTNRPLTEKEIVLQTKEILSSIIPNGQKIWIHWPEIHKTWVNPVKMNIRLDEHGDREEGIKLLDKYLNKSE